MGEDEDDQYVDEFEEDDQEPAEDQEETRGARG
jgi:hypothetical protein